MPTAVSHRGRSIRRIAIIYDSTIRPDTTGEYCRRALEGLGITVSHFQPGEITEIPSIYDLYFRVDDDLDYRLPDTLSPLAYWAIDTHRDHARRLDHARTANFVFCAQRNGASRMRADGIPGASWLPLACEPEIHHRIPGRSKQYDICFVGNTFPGDGERSRLVEWIRATFPRAFVGRAYGEEMARIYSASRLVFNCAIRDDVNMRVFEAAACGSLLVTNDLTDYGQDLLFTPDIHLVTYRDSQELPDLIQRFLQDEGQRERIAEAGMRHAHAHHTYRQRMTDLLAVVSEGVDLEAKYPIEGQAPGPIAARTGELQWVPSRRERSGESRDGQSGNGKRQRISEVEHPESTRMSNLEIRNSKFEIRNSSEGRPKVSIIIPAFNHLALSQQCIASIRRSTDVPHETIIVDNGSTDGTAAWARGEGLRVIANAENLGFPQACNQGILAADGSYLLLLNNDTAVSPGWLTRLLSHAEDDSSVGLVGPSTNLAGSIQQIPASYASMEEFLVFAQELARGRAGQAQEVNRLVGLCLLIPRRVVQTVGLLDTRFGLGLFEDDDYCLRVQMAGFRLLWAMDVFIHHEGHRTFHSLPEEDYLNRLQANERLLRDKWDIARYLRPWEEESRLIARLQAGTPAAWDLLRAGRYTEAYDAFETLARQDPTNAKPLLGLGLAAEGRGVPAAATLAYRTVLQLAPGDPDAGRGLARISQGADAS